MNRQMKVLQTASSQRVVGWCGGGTRCFIIDIDLKKYEKAKKKIGCREREKGCVWFDDSLS